MATQYDAVVRGGTVPDGTGGDLREADSAIRDGRCSSPPPGGVARAPRKT